MNTVSPIATGDRIEAIDVIRGFALFGVLWMNLFEHRGLVVPYDSLDHLPTAKFDHWIGFVSQWLMQGKAQALFSLLFGFGFANIMSRLEARGAPKIIFLRRIAILLVFGLIDIFLLWIGDILAAYAVMGFFLYFTRNWSTRALLLVGLPVAVLGTPLLILATQLIWNGEMWWIALWDQGAEIRSRLFVQSDYPAYVAELWRGTWVEWWTTPAVLAYLAQIFGRFLLGSWLFRQGWLFDVGVNRQLFFRVAKFALPAGLVLAGVSTAISWFEMQPAWTGRTIEQFATLVLACGYGSAIALLQLAGRFGILFAGFRAVGRMALTNYIAQSLFYIFVIYGFGFGLLPWLGATLSLALAIAFFGVQMVFSKWWLTHFRFGPLEWLWRCLTYGERQPMRGIAAA